MLPTQEDRNELVNPQKTGLFIKEMKNSYVRCFSWKEMQWVSTDSLALETVSVIVRARL